MSHEFSFIHLQICFLLWKVIQKYGYIQEEGEDALLESLSSVLGISFQRLCRSRSNPPVVNCAPIPKMVPHSLNEQKCIGELVRAGCECSQGWRWRQVREASVLTSPSPLASRVNAAPCTPFSTKKKKKKQSRSSSRLHSMLDQVSGSTTTRKTVPSSADLVRVLVTSATLPQTNTTQCPYGRSALANPTRLMWEQKKKTTKRKT